METGSNVHFQETNALLLHPHSLWLNFVVFDQLGCSQLETLDQQMLILTLFLPHWAFSWKATVIYMLKVQNIVQDMAALSTGKKKDNSKFQLKGRVVSILSQGHLYCVKNTE